MMLSQISYQCPFPEIEILSFQVQIGHIEGASVSLSGKIRENRLHISLE